MIGRRLVNGVEGAGVSPDDRGFQYGDGLFETMLAVNGRVRRFIGRPSGGEIVLLSDEEDPQLRWRFTDIAADSFTWRAETSRDGGATWHIDEQMLATRISRG